MSKSELKFRSKYVLVIEPQVCSLCVEILQILHPHSVFKTNHTRLRRSEFTCDLLFIDTKLTSRQIRYYSRDAESVVIYGKVPENLNASFHPNCQIVESSNVFGELWEKFTNFWLSLKSQIPAIGDVSSWFANLGWVSKPIYEYLRTEDPNYRYKSPFDLQPDVQLTDFTHYQYNKEAFYIYYFCAMTIREYGDPMKASTMTIVLMLSRDDMMKKGREIVQQRLLDLPAIVEVNPFGSGLLDIQHEREILINDRIYRCFLVVSRRPIGEAETSMMLMRNPHVDVVVYVMTYRPTLVEYFFRQKLNEETSVDEISQDFEQMFEQDGMKPQPDWSSLTVRVRRKNTAKYMRRFVCSQPFDEQDAEDLPHLLASARNLVLDDIKMHCNSQDPMRECIIDRQIYQRIIGQLKKTFTVRYNHVEIIMQCIRETLQERLPLKKEDSTEGE